MSEARLPYWLRGESPIAAMGAGRDPITELQQTVLELSARIARLESRLTQHLIEQHEIGPLAGELGLDPEGRQS